ncbi:hypothetical protein RND81_05G116100 [Saponaria officinalis]|uniref:Uncharacterized protein n=1 Tax=Saponaria officinalis TaxID=3572 RepID=A0AAW1KRR9_SAPOF
MVYPIVPFTIKAAVHIGSASTAMSPMILATYRLQFSPKMSKNYLACRHRTCLGSKTRMTGIMLSACLLRKHHTIIEVGPKGILARNNVLQWVLKKVVRDEPTEQTAGEQVTQFSAEPTATLITKHNMTTSSTVDPTNVGMVNPKPGHPPSTPEQKNKSSSLIRGSPIVDEIPAQVSVGSSLLNKFDAETTAPQVSDLGEDEPITKA